MRIFRNARPSLLLSKARVTALLAIGAMIAPAHAIYTGYEFADDTPVYNLDMYSTWAFDPVFPNYVFAAYEFFFESSQLGYIGTQIGDHKGAIFAIWDDGEDSGTAQPVSGKGCERFGGEGTGTSCAIRYKWVAGHEYRQRIRSVGYQDGAEHWKGSIRDMTTGVETVLGVIAVKDIDGHKGYGWLHPGGVTFLEFFGGQSCHEHAYTRVTWRGPYANDNSAKASSAVASYDAEGCKNNNNIAKHRPRVIQESGIGVVRVTPDGQELWKQNQVYESSATDPAGDDATRVRLGVRVPRLHVDR